MERYDSYYFLTLPLPLSNFSTLAAWFKGSITLPGDVEIFADSSAWYYVMLSTSGSEITYTVYALDGTEVLSDSYDYVGRYATPSTDILLTGHIDELIYDATTALDPTTAIESKLPWGDGLDASKTWLVVHAKDPEAVSSNAFLTRDLGTYETTYESFPSSSLIPIHTGEKWQLTRFAKMTELTVPYLSFGNNPAGFTYNFRAGWIMQIANMVWFSARIQLSVKPATTGIVRFHLGSEAPEPRGLLGNTIDAVSIYLQNTSIPATPFGYMGVGAVDNAIIINYISSGALGTMTNSHVANNSLFFVSGHYLTEWGE